MLYPMKNHRSLLNTLTASIGAVVAAAATVTCTPHAVAQWAVYDAKSDANALIHHGEDLLKFGQMIDHQVQQINRAVETINRVNYYIQIVGDPMQIINMVGLDPALAELANSGIGQTINSLGQLADGAAALQDSGRGLYQTVQSVGQSGFPIPRASDIYRRYDAINRSVYNYQDVQDDTLARTRAARTAMKGTLARLDKATTQTEVNKLQGVLAAQAAELNDLRAELAAAAHGAAVQKLQNDNNAGMKRQAAAEEFASSFNDASDKFNGGGQ